VDIEPRPVERRSGLTREVFISEFLASRRPVIITDAMSDWQLSRFTPESLVRAFGNEEVQIYDDLFSLQRTSTLRRYVKQHVNKPESAPRSTEYVRWYTQLKDVEFVWADAAFARLRDAWDMPYFFPDSSMVVPPSAGVLNPAEARFPYKGLFVSGRGARTRLHRDPWNSDALLCQLYGKKVITIYGADQTERLTSGHDFVDPGAPDEQRFPTFSKAKAAYRVTLEPGEIILFPGGSFHDVTSLTDSVSITWNFLHACNLHRFCEHVAKHPQEPELDIVRFFLKESLPPAASAEDILRVVNTDRNVRRAL
jgi:hypothetical protein